MASDPRIEAAARAIRQLDGEPQAPLVAYGDDARFVLAAADAADPLRDRDQMLKAIEDGYERIVRAGFAFTTEDLAVAVFDAIQEASDG